MLPNSEIVGKVLLDQRDGLINSLAKGATVIEMSSGVPGETAKIGLSLQERGISMIDAPVSGGVRKAATGELAIMVGGQAQTIESCMPLLKTMGTRVFTTGALGTGQAMKALNNLVSAAGFIAGIEALLIGKRVGLDPLKMVQILNASTGKNNSTEHKFAQFVLTREFNAGFSLDLMVKDVSIALGLSKESGTPAMLSSLTRELWAAASLEAGRGADHTAVTLLLEKLAGLKL
jgi:3-hydroxyisobutyrate dehydrogenase